MQSQVKRYISALNKLSEQKGYAVFTTDELKKVSTSMGLSILDFPAFIDGLNTQGYLLKKGPQAYALQTSPC